MLEEHRVAFSESTRRVKAKDKGQLEKWGLNRDKRRKDVVSSRRVKIRR